MTNLGDRMRRREFIVLFGAAIGVWPLATHAQQAAKLPVIGFLGANTPLVQSEWTEAFVHRLRELGWMEDHNIRIEYRWAEGHFDRSPKLADELVQLNVDVIVTHATANVLAAKQATSSIPIVFAAVADPVGNKLVASLAQPGANVTGLSNEAADLAGKRLELLRDITPRLRRVAMLANVATPNAVLEIREVNAAAPTLDLEVIGLKYVKLTISAPRLKRSRVGRRHCMSNLIRSLILTELRSAPWL
jgi:putative ABC transport system substrate-binding protein